MQVYVGSSILNETSWVRVGPQSNGSELVRHRKEEKMSREEADVETEAEVGKLQPKPRKV